MTISASLRFEILRRDNHTCTYCGGKAPDVELTVDHVNPQALGGVDDPSNLVAACRDCNAGKGSTPPDAERVADVDAKALAYRDALIRAAEMLRDEAEVSNIVAGYFESKWDSWGVGDGAARKLIWKPATWRATIINYMERGLPEDDLIEAIGIAMHGPASLDDKWKYFCGVCRRKVEKIAELAMKLLEANDEPMEPAPPEPKCADWSCTLCGAAADVVAARPNRSHRWVALCDECLADRYEDEPYTVGVEYLQWQVQIDWWTNHLAQKSWFVFDSWAELIAAFAGGDVTATEPPPITNETMWSPDGTE